MLSRPNGFHGTTVLIVGDLMADCYVSGDVHRISQEAPVPVLAVRQRRWAAGGAANVAMNVAGLRGTAILAGVAGDDSAGRRLAGLLKEQAIRTDGIAFDPDRPTTCKTRVMSGNHQIVRLDEEVTADLDSRQENELLERILLILEEPPHAVVLSDYAKGALTDRLLAAVIAACRDRRVPVLVDPKKPDYRRYAGATCVTPNFHEFQQALLTMALPRDDFAESGHCLRQAIGCEFLLVTQGAEGMTLFGPDGQSCHLPALAREVFDISGAGDTVIATLATCAGAGMKMESAMTVANAAASIVVTKVGTAPVQWEDLARLLETQQLFQHGGNTAALN